MRNLKLQYPGGCVFYDKLNIACMQTLMLKTNCDLVGGKFVGWCFAVQNLREFA